VLAFLRSRKSSRKGVGWVDCQLLAGALVGEAKLWSLEEIDERGGRDRRGFDGNIVAETRTASRHTVSERACPLLALPFAAQPGEQHKSPASAARCRSSGHVVTCFCA